MAMSTPPSKEQHKLWCGGEGGEKNNPVNHNGKSGKGDAVHLLSVTQSLNDPRGALKGGALL